MPIRIPLFLTVAAILLAGCATPTPVAHDTRTDIDQQILDAAKKIQAAQTELYQAAAINRESEKPAIAITENEQLITIAWQGDALQLLNKLAHDRGLQFTSLGIKQSLPVNVDVKASPFTDVLDQVRAQVGYRATVTQYPDKLMLQYNRPQS